MIAPEMFDTDFDQIEVPDRLGERKRLKTSKPQADTRTLADQSTGRKKGDKIKLMDKYKAALANCRCTICDAKDCSPDPVTPSQNRLWAYYLLNSKGVIVAQIVPDYITRGSSCWYCVRVWNARFMEVYTLTEYKEELGKD